jgi:hypothetical protein
LYTPRMEIGSALAILASANITKPMLERLLGPTFDYLGDGLRDLSEKRARNIGNIVMKAIQKAENLGAEGEVPPRVIKNIFDGGSFSDDQIMAEYLGGVLASSKSPGGRDDRGVALSGLVNQLSAYTLRTHYILYLAARKTTPPIATRWKAAGRDLRVGDIREARIVATFISFAAFNRAMAFEPFEDATGATAHAFYALLKEQLFTEWSAGDVEHLRTKYNNVTEAGIVFLPSVPGIELFLWAHGKGHKPTSAFFDPDEDFELDVPLDIDPGGFGSPHPPPSQ